jgi:putative transcriptional regulator
VVLLTHHNEEGAMGLVLSRPTDVCIVDAVPELAYLPWSSDRVYTGGPVSPDSVLALADWDNVGEAVSPIVASVGLVPGAAIPGELAVSRLRVFAGYSGWGAGQLEEELEEEAWYVFDAQPDDVFADDPDELWRSVLLRQGEAYALLATMPFDPRLN